MRRLAAIFLAIFTVQTGASVAAEPARIYAAGSLSGALPKLIAASGLPASDFAPPVFGPAGLLGQRLLGGEKADLFASADLAQPRLVVSAKGGMVVPFIQNRMCVAAPKSLGLTTDNLLDRLLDPKVRLATSTPGADPGGDYAMAVFDRADAVHPGATAILSAKALKLVGGPNSMSPASVFAGHHADALLFYCSSAAATVKELPDLVSTRVPEALEVHPLYGLAILSDRPDVQRLALFILSERGQQILAEGGLVPMAPGADSH
jgi:ABC-type molybdate transport system substrate-binding protein